MEKSVRNQILDLLKYKKGLSCYEVSMILGKSHNTLSSLMKRMVDEGVLKREKGEGPKGGFGYYINNESTHHKVK